MRITRVFALFTLLATVVSFSTAGADTQDSVKARIQARLSSVDQLKVAGLVGENNQGYLEQRSSLDAQQSALMQAENADRRILYGMIAHDLGYSSSVIGEQRAAQIRKNSVAGIWLQSPEGNWYQK
jgi:hypothetical protein